MPNQLLVGTPQGATWQAPEGAIAIAQSTITGSLGSVLVATVNPLASGDNTIAVPAGSRGVLIYPPSGNTSALTYREVSLDTGSRIDKTAVKAELFDTTALPANVIINSTGGFAGVLTAVFF